MTDELKSKPPLTGRKVLLMVVGFFAVIIASNAFMMTKAVTSFRGEDTKKSYLQGIHYNDTLQKRAVQKQAGWSAVLDYDTKSIQLTIKDAQNDPVSRLKPVGKLRHPTDTALDMELVFKVLRPGVYIASLPEGIQGQRVLLTRAETESGFTFETKNEIWLQ